MKIWDTRICVSVYTRAVIYTYILWHKWFHALFQFPIKHLHLLTYYFFMFSDFRVFLSVAFFILFVRSPWLKAFVEILDWCIFFIYTCSAYLLPTLILVTFLTLSIMFFSSSFYKTEPQTSAYFNSHVVELISTRESIFVKFCHVQDRTSARRNGVSRPGWSGRRTFPVVGRKKCLVSLDLVAQSGSYGAITLAVIICARAKLLRVLE